MTELKKTLKEGKKPMTGMIITTYHPEEVKRKLMHSHCLRCGKKLKNVDYMKLGYGPVCYQKVNVKNKIKLF